MEVDRGEMRLASATMPRRQVNMLTQWPPSQNPKPTIWKPDIPKHITLSLITLLIFIQPWTCCYIFFRWSDCILFKGKVFQIVIWLCCVLSSNWWTQHWRPDGFSHWLALMGKRRQSSRILYKSLHHFLDEDFHQNCGKSELSLLYAEQMSG